MLIETDDTYISKIFTGMIIINVIKIILVDSNLYILVNCLIFFFIILLPPNSSREANPRIYYYKENFFQWKYIYITNQAGNQ